MHTSMLTLEALLSKRRKVQDCKDESGKAYAAFAQDNKRKAQKGVLISSVQTRSLRACRVQALSADLRLDCDRRDRVRPSSASRP